MTRILFVFLFMASFINVSAQQFTLLAKNKHLLNDKGSNWKQNAVVFNNKVYYTTELSNADGTSNLVEADLDGDNIKTLSKVVMYGSNSLAATNHFIYYTSCNVNANDFYHLHRYNPATKTNEMIMEVDKKTAWCMATNNVLFCRMYPHGDKLILKSSLNLYKCFAIVDDDSPVANAIGYDGESGSYSTGLLEESNDAIAITDSFMYVYYENATDKHKSLLGYSIYKHKDSAKYNMPIYFDFDTKGFTTFSKLTSIGNDVYTFIAKKDAEKTDEKKYLVKITNRSKGNDVDSFNINTSKVERMENINGNLYIWDGITMYVYNDKVGKKILLNATDKGFDYFVQLKNSNLLYTNDGTIFLAMVKKNGDVGDRSVIAINPDFSITTISTDKGLTLHNTIYESFFVLGNKLIKSSYFSTNYERCLYSFEKATNWLETKIDYPEVKDYQKETYDNDYLSMIQLPNGILISTKYMKPTDRGTYRLKCMYLLQ